jgi:CDP-6-deoxy-D-xylo-4-hexulose-3-dehydrase
MTSDLRAEPYRLAADTFGEEELAVAIEVLQTRRVTMGERVRAFESEFAAWTNARHAVMVNSGSSANLLMIDALLRRTNGDHRLVPGDEVLVPGLAWPTTVWPLVQLGLVPVWVDVDLATLGMDLGSAEASLGPRTKAILPIHPLGRALDMDAYRAFCAAHGLTLLEDTCESLGAHWGGRHVGTFGLMGSFSFYFSHHISTIEGGMIVTDDTALNDDLRSLRSHGWVRDRSDRDQLVRSHPGFDDRFLFVMPGYNVRPTELQAAIGSVQLRRLDEMLEARVALAHEVAALMAETVPWLELVGADTFGDGRPARVRERVHSWMTLPFRLAEDAPLSRVATMEHLERNGVETRPLLAGNLFRHPAAQGIVSRQAPSLHHCDELLERAFMIGCHPVLSAPARQTLDRALRSLAEA